MARELLAAAHSGGARPAVAACRNIGLSPRRRCRLDSDRCGRRHRRRRDGRPSTGSAAPSAARSPLATVTHRIFGAPVAAALIEVTGTTGVPLQEKRPELPSADLASDILEGNYANIGVLHCDFPGTSYPDIRCDWGHDPDTALGCEIWINDVLVVRQTSTGIHSAVQCRTYVHTDAA
jgi:hypothetical protein